MPTGATGKKARLLVANKTVAAPARDGWATVSIASVLDHEVVVLE
jgi:hypothetical protein